MKKDLRKKVLSLTKNGYIKTSQLIEAGIRKNILKEMVESGELIQCSRGVYMVPDVWEDEFYLFQQKYKRGIFSHDTALYLLGYCERVPLTFHMTFPASYHTKSIKNENMIVTRVLNEKYDIGIITVETPLGNKVQTYDLERSLCDVIRGSRQDIQTVQFAMRKYAMSKEKDINKLMAYAKIFRVESKIRRYMEVLL